MIIFDGLISVVAKDDFTIGEASSVFFNCGSIHTAIMVTGVAFVLPS